MAESKTEYVPRTVSPPGATLLDLLEERQVSQAELARRMGRPLKTVNEIIRGKASITPETALQLEAVLGTAAEFWNARERNYRAFLVRAEQQRELRRHGKWAKRFPIRAMERLGWIEKQHDPGDQVKEVLQFLSIASVEQWPELARDCRASLRVSQTIARDEFSLLVWLRAGRSAGERRVVERYTSAAFKLALAKARRLTTSRPDEAICELVTIFAAAGVVLTIVPELPGCRASGATMWVSGSRAVIQLSLRHKSDDHFWFTLFHEAAHLLLHSKSAVFIDSAVGGDDAVAEEEANRWARDFLVPMAEWKRFIAAGQVSLGSVRAFAEELGIAPGIVVGRLQHEKRIPFSHMNQLKQKVGDRLHAAARMSRHTKLG